MQCASANAAPALPMTAPAIAASPDGWHVSAIMVARTQITLEPEYHRKARTRAAELGISLAEYLRGLVARDLEGPRRIANPELVFDLGTSTRSDIAKHKDDYLGEAAGAGRNARRTSTRGRKR